MKIAKTLHFVFVALRTGDNFRDDNLWAFKQHHLLQVENIVIISDAAEPVFGYGQSA